MSILSSGISLLEAMSDFISVQYLALLPCSITEQKCSEKSFTKIIAILTILKKYSTGRCLPDQLDHGSLKMHMLDSHNCNQQSELQPLCYQTTHSKNAALKNQRIVSLNSAEGCSFLYKIAKELLLYNAKLTGAITQKNVLQMFGRKRQPKNNLMVSGEHDTNHFCPVEMISCPL